LLREGSDEVVIAGHGPGRFLGELNLVTGQRPYLSARVSRAGRVLSVEPEQFRRLMSTKPDLSDTIFGAIVARRELLRSAGAAGAILFGGRDVLQGTPSEFLQGDASNEQPRRLLGTA